MIDMFIYEFIFFNTFFVSCTNMHAVHCVFVFLFILIYYAICTVYITSSKVFNIFCMLCANISPNAYSCSWALGFMCPSLLFHYGISALLCWKGGCSCQPLFA